MKEINSVSFAFGIFSIQNGLTVLEAFLISLTNLTSAGQLAGVPIIAGGGTLLELAATQLVINSRYALMSISLSQKLGTSVKLIDRFYIAHGNTDEIFAIATSNRKNVGNRYMYGLMTLPIIGWTVGTLLGALAGDILPESVLDALGVAIYGMFVAIGLAPENEPFRKVADLNEYGYIRSSESCLTKTEGVFVAGDCRSKKIRQVATAAADGAVAALAACDYLDK